MIAVQRLILTLLVLTMVLPSGHAMAWPRLEAVPSSEQWFGIYVDNEQVGFYHQSISAEPDGYRIETSGSVQMKVMGFSKESAMRESYLVKKSLALRSFEIEQKINGISSRITGSVTDTGLRVKRTAQKDTTEKTLRVRGDIIPGPLLNYYPLLKPITAGAVHKVMTFDPEEVKVKELKIIVEDEEKLPDGRTALKLSNNLYPFVSNEIWVDAAGATLLESVRDGLVVTKAGTPQDLGRYVGAMALGKKDLIYDFSMVRAEPTIRNVKGLKGLAVELSGWNNALPLFQGGGQTVTPGGTGQITIKTGSLAGQPPAIDPAELSKHYLEPAEQIESDAPVLIAKARELAVGKTSSAEIASALAAWTATWITDSVDDGGGALTSFTERTGNCQTHTRLYVALARAAGIPSRFVSGLVAVDARGFLYHSWAESLLGGKWVAVDPTYNQLPADPTHLKLLEGHLPENLAPIVAIIGKIRLKVLATE